MFVFLLHGHAREQGGKQGENESLDKGDDAFQKPHKHVENERNEGNAVAKGGAVQTAKDEYQGNDTERDDMAGGDVGEKTDHQHEGLRENADELHNRHQRDGKFEEPRHARRVDDVFPVVLVGRKGGHQESDDSQDTGDGNVAGDVGATRENRDQPHQVVDKDEEKQGEQIGEVFFVFVAQGRNGDFVTDKQDERFHKPPRSVGSLVLALLVLLCHFQEEPQQDDDRNDQGTHILGDGYVDNGGIRVDELCHLLLIINS